MGRPWEEGGKGEKGAAPGEREATVRGMPSSMLRQIRRLSPAFWAFLGLGMGMYGGVRGWGNWARGAALLFWWVLCRASGCGRARSLSWGLLPLLGMGWAALRIFLLEAPFEEAFPRGRGYGEFSLTVVETPLAQGALAPWDSGGGHVVGELRQVSGRPLRRRVLLREGTASRQALLRGLPVGTRLQGRGSLVPVSQEGDPLSSWGDSLLSRRILRLLVLEEWRVAGRETGPALSLRQGLQRLRELLGAWLVEGVDNPLDGQMLLALGLGAAECLPREWRQRQAWAGTIHVFAISGMHVGMVALMLGALLPWTGLPLAWRRPLLALATTAYVVVTGASPSGMRALAMTLAVLFARMRWRAPSWRHAQGLSGLAALAANPLCLHNLGFLYSHAVVAILLLAAPLLRELQDTLLEREQWLPRERRRPGPSLLARWLAGALGAGLLAWLAALCLALETNGRLGMLSPLVNLPLGLLISLALAFCPLRLLLGLLLPAGTRLWTATAQTLIHLAGSLSLWGSQGNFCLPVASPPPWARLLLLLSLAGLLLRWGGLRQERRYSGGRKESKR